MMRRPLSLGLLAALAVSGGIALPPASAGTACVTYDDAAGDAKLAPTGQTLDTDEDLDILGLSLNNTATELAATITVKKLAANPAKAPGHGFTFGYTFAEKKFVHSYYKYGQAAGDQAATAAEITYSSSVAGTSRAIPVTAAFDTAKNAVTLKVRLADLEPWAFAPAFDASLTALTAQSSTDYFASGETYDSLAAPATASYQIRYGCGDGVVDLGTPPAPPVGPAPDASPRANCTTATDAKSDGTPTIADPAKAPNEPSLDVVGFAVNTTATDIKAYVQVDKLADKPVNFFGDRYEFVFGYQGKTYTLAVGRLTPPADTVTADPNRGQLNGTTNAAIKPKGAFDKATNTVVISVSRAALETVHAGPIPYGAVLTGLQVNTWGLQPGLQFPADTAKNANDTKYTVGYSRCFVPPAAKLAPIGTPSVQYSDVATLSAKLTTEDGDVLSGKSVTFTLGGKSATVKSNASGVATAAIQNTLAAGAGAYTVAFAGDPAAGPASVTGAITSRVEGTRLSLSVKKSGTSRTVTATLKDDDGKAIAGQVVTWTINGKAKGSGKTDSLGRVILRTAKPTQTVVAKFAGLSSKYAGSTAKAKV